METQTHIPNHIPNRMVEACQSVRPSLCDHLVNRNLMTTDQVWKAVMQYRLGSSRNDGTVFWQIDTDGNVHDGRIAFFNPDCTVDRNKQTTWVSTLLKANGTLPVDMQRTECLFGEHLLSLADPSRIVAIIESEKSALILSALFPDVTWLATGDGVSLTAATLVRLHNVSHGADMILFPRTDPNGHFFRCYEEMAITASVRNGKPIYVWKELESIADDQKASMPDIVEWLSCIRVPHLR